MKILVTGAKGFVGKNLIVTLQSLTDTNDKHTIYEYDLDTDPSMLSEYTRDCGFVFHLAGVNRPKEQEEFMEGNFGFTSTLLASLKEHHNTCPVMISSSTQAAIANPYGLSKKAGEDLLFDYSSETGAKVLVYRFPNVFGKWSRPNYNSAVATFCYNIAHDLPVVINDRSTKLSLVYIDDVVNELLQALQGCEHMRQGDGSSVALFETDEPSPCRKTDGLETETDEPSPCRKISNKTTENLTENATDEPSPCRNYCCVEIVHSVTLGQIVDLLYSFRDSRTNLLVSDMTDAFTKKLYATFTSFLPEDKFSYLLKMNVDQRGSFTEFLKTPERGQVSVNISKPGITKGNHWHHTKTEKFLVVSGRGVIRFRKIGVESAITTTEKTTKVSNNTDINAKKNEDINAAKLIKQENTDIIEYFVSGEKLEVVDIPTGYTHNIENLGDVDMVTIMWANEAFDKDRPDTFLLEV